MQTIKNMVQSFFNRWGYEIRAKTSFSRGPMISDEANDKMNQEYFENFKKLGIDKIHYGCGSHLFDEGWVNVDLSPLNPDPSKIYVPANLSYIHPFPSEFFRFGFAEDFLEHLDQADSIIFLSEAFRTLRPGGVLRLSFPGLRGVMTKHYRESNFYGAYVGRIEAYTMWEHKHFYCEESLSFVARHLGFSNVEFAKYGESKHQELQGLEFRVDQKDLNLFAELTK